MAREFQALSSLHQRGITHRDLKPSNLLVTGEHLEVVDTGSIRPCPRTSRSSSAPSSARSSTRTWTRRAARRRTCGLRAASLEGLGEARSRLDAIVQKLLASKPEDRYPSAAEVIDDLGLALGRPFPVETAETRESFLQAATFAGREVELRTLLEALRRARAGEGSAFLVAGESGIGKSRLLDELRTAALVNAIRVVRGQTVTGRGGQHHLWTPIVRALCLHAEIDDQAASFLKDIAPDIASLLGRPVGPAAPRRRRSRRCGSSGPWRRSCATTASPWSCSWRTCSGPAATASLCSITSPASSASCPC